MIKSTKNKHITYLTGPDNTRSMIKTKKLRRMPKKINAMKHVSKNINIGIILMRIFFYIF